VVVQRSGHVITIVITFLAWVKLFLKVSREPVAGYVEVRDGGAQSP
jgi:hypothetical protein